MFKVAFTSNDQPGLLGIYGWLGASRLITLAKLVFSSSGLAFIYVLVARVLRMDRATLYPGQAKSTS